MRSAASLLPVITGVSPARPTSSPGARLVPPGHPPGARLAAGLSSMASAWSRAVRPPGGRGVPLDAHRSAAGEGPRGDEAAPAPRQGKMGR